MSFICMRNYKKSCSHQWVCTLPHFETEAIDNLEIDYYGRIKLVLGLIASTERFFLQFSSFRIYSPQNSPQNIWTSLIEFLQS